MALEKELATYKDRLPELLEHNGRFVLIHGTQVVDTFSSYDDAIKEGYKQFSLEPFLVKQIQQVEKIAYITRHVHPHSESRVS